MPASESESEGMGELVRIRIAIEDWIANFEQHPEDAGTEAAWEPLLAGIGQVIVQAKAEAVREARKECGCDSCRALLD